MNLFLDTLNSGKIRELKHALRPFNICIYTPYDFDYSAPDETGDTFYDNALIKAQSALAQTGMPTLADDSGLCVDALDGAPGVYTAGYGGYNILLEAMKCIPDGARGASFYCVLVLCMPEVAPLSWSGVVRGTICQHAAADDYGFGYDPVFQPDSSQKAFSEMSASEKQCISHRGRALEGFLHWVRQQNLNSVGAV